MVKPVYRRKSIGTKVSEEEYARLEALAGGRAMSEWAREVLLRELDGRQARPADETLLAEVLTLRTILLNLHFTVAKGQAITAEEMQAIIDRADANKVQKAIEKLTLGAVGAVSAGLTYEAVGQFFYDAATYATSLATCSLK